jgi:signal peptidase II
MFGVAAVAVALDQWTKHWASGYLAWREPVSVVGDLVRLTYTRNSGIAFGMFAGLNFPFYWFSIVAAIAVVALWARHATLAFPRQLSLALVLGGALGNLVDRVRTGEVVDFILLAWGRHEFPVFNVADVCVTCGVILFALVWVNEPGASDDRAAGAEEADGPQAGDPGAGDGRGSAPGPVAGETADRPLP